MNQSKYSTNDIPKVTLHEHLEGTVSVNLARKLARKYQVDLKDLLFHPNCRSRNYYYDKSDFNAFLHAYDKISGLVRSNADYYYVTYNFLEECAKSNAVYAELIVSPSHMAEVDGKIDEKQYIERMISVEMAINEAKQHLDIDANLIATGVRNIGVANTNKISELIANYPSSKLKGFGMAGNEKENNYKMFASGFKNAKNAGLGLSLHAGEICGAENIWDAILYGADRIGHGITSVHDEKLIKYLADNKVLLEVCPTSNAVLVPEINADYSNHPLRTIYENGVKISLNTDDAALVHTTLENEYQVAADKFDFSRAELLDVSLCAIESSFADKNMKKELIGKIYDHITSDDKKEFKELAKQTKNDILSKRLLDRALGKIYE